MHTPPLLYTTRYDYVSEPCKLCKFSEISNGMSRIRLVLRHVTRMRWLSCGFDDTFEYQLKRLRTRFSSDMSYCDSTWPRIIWRDSNTMWCRLYVPTNCFIRNNIKGTLGIKFCVCYCLQSEIQCYLNYLISTELMWDIVCQSLWKWPQSLIRFLYRFWHWKYWK